LTSLDMRPPTAQRAPDGVSRPDEDAEAARLYEEYSEQLLRFCGRRLGSHGDAEDAVQVTFLYAVRALRRGVVPESESAWLHAIAANVCRWQQRTSFRRGGPLAAELDLDRVAGSPPGDGDRRGLCRDLIESLRSLPAAQRRALVLREWHGLPSSEVAARLGLSASATYALLTRARRSFVEAFEARREAVMGLQLGALVYQVRHHLKTLFGTASAKAAATVATAAVVGVGAVAVERSGGGDRPSGGSGPAVAIVPAGATASVSGPAAGAREAGRSAPTTRETRSGPAAAVARPRPRSDSGAVVVPPRRPSDPTSEPAPTPPTSTPAPAPGPGSSEPSKDPSKKPVPSVPVEPPKLPEVDLPTDLVPPLDLPPLPEADLPPVDLPPVDVPSADLPPADVPPVDLPPVEPPPLPPLP
jgi:RNA polymerase sigma factor (sigma-70 family)